MPGIMCGFREQQAKGGDCLPLAIAARAKYFAVRCEVFDLGLRLSRGKEENRSEPKA